jgi:hypothetical protein
MKLTNRARTIVALLALAITVLGAPGVGLADDGAAVKTRKVPTDVVQEPGKAAETRRYPTDAMTLPEAQRPGTHTMTFEVARSLAKSADKNWKGGSVSCHTVKKAGPGWIEAHVGWGEIEFGDSPCAATIVQRAVLFDDGELGRIPTRTIDRAVLSYTEAVGIGCYFVVGEDSTCWQNGEGEPEQKPDGCAVVRVPTWDWTAADPGGLIPFAADRPQARRLGAAEWDVTEPYRWQNGGAPIGSTPAPGFLLTGSITALSDLEGEDDTICISQVSNVQLQVTYTVPQPSGPPDVVR